MWVSLQELSIALYHKKSIHNIACLIGTLLKIDEPAAACTRSSFASICIKINLVESLVHEIWLGDEDGDIIQKILYENLHQYCFSYKLSFLFSQREPESLDNVVSDAVAFINAVAVEAFENSGLKVPKHVVKTYSFLLRVKDNWDQPTEAFGMLKLHLKLEKCIPKVSFILLEEKKRLQMALRGGVEKKRVKSFIHKISVDNREILDSSEILQSGVDFFKSLFLTSNSQVPANLLDLFLSNLPIIHTETFKDICDIPSLEDIKQVVFEISPDTVASPDGFFASFFQASWDLIAQDLFEAIRDYFSGTSLPHSFSATTTVLIPKIKNPNSWPDF
ncbi:hypothetical protein BUALT_Bualt07G0080100 [Buddleja alternifolia]|uniref:Uncharacterized protein n=1 Tax=Buddleja alternifolia TaxID=168488 RepID=A0AAV6XG09_9LAMI|nr:hypothetical protein BUALT_Bualt07G0080100 [Buddleja alternifolia]